jgi:hypothetical protein
MFELSKTLETLGSRSEGVKERICVVVSLYAVEDDGAAQWERGFGSAIRERCPRQIA